MEGSLGPARRNKFASEKHIADRAAECNIQVSCQRLYRKAAAALRRSDGFISQNLFF